MEPLQTVAEQVVNALRNAIVSGQLEANTELRLSEVASHFQVSTTPVRDALLRLSHEGLVLLEKYHSATVVSLTKEEVREIVQLRQLLEPMAIREAINAMDMTTLTKMETSLCRMASAETWEMWVQYHRTFHRDFYEASLPRVVSLLTELQDAQVAFVSSRLRGNLPSMREATVLHNEIAETARGGVEARLIEVVLRHLVEWPKDVAYFSSSEPETRMPASRRSG
jgi:DNA-binding GntR family transcriptional regulator